MFVAQDLGRVTRRPRAGPPCPRPSTGTARQQGWERPPGPHALFLHLALPGQSFRAGRWQTLRPSTSGAPDTPTAAGPAARACSWSWTPLPLPQEQEQKLGGRGGDGGSREKDLVMLPVTLRRGSWSFGSAGALSDAGAGPGSLDDSSHGAEAVALHHQQQQQQLRGSLRRVSIREEESEVEGGVQTEGADGDFLTLTVPMGEVSLDALHGPESYSYYTDAAFSARGLPHMKAPKRSRRRRSTGCIIVPATSLPALPPHLRTPLWAGQGQMQRRKS